MNKRQKKKQQESQKHWTSIVIHLLLDRHLNMKDLHV